jgi:hypothetical protein
MKTGAFFSAVVVGGLALGSGTAWAGKRVSCGPDVQLNVQIKGTPAAPGDFRLVSDGNEFYNDGGSGSQKITAIFQVDNCTHDFTLNLNFSSRYVVALLSDRQHASKFFNFDRAASVPITPGPEDTAFGSVGFCAEELVRNSDGTIRRNADGSYQDNYAGCGVDAAGWYVRRHASIGLYEGPTSDYGLRFQGSPLDNRNYPCASDPSDPVCSTSYVRVYHPTASTWVLRPEEPATASLVKWIEQDYRFQNYETVPAEIVVTRK